MLVMYGIKNCDTVKKARRWLEQQQVNYQFHDYRADGVDEALLRRFVDKWDWTLVLNRRGTSWRKLDKARQQQVSDTASAIQIMLEQPAMIKRPLLCEDHQPLLLGFSEEAYQQHFGHSH